VRGLVLAGVGRIVYRTDLPEPALEAPTDAIVAVRRAGLCGSDLHPYEGREPVRFGVITGHEVVGDVVDTGTAVAAFRPGDRVLVPFTTSCGACPECRRGLSARCRSGQLFGYGAPGDPGAPALHGGQAEYVRVPLADGTLVRQPDGLDDAGAVLLTDNLPTGWYAAERAGVAAGDTVAVVGLGSVGLCAVVAARDLGAGHVVAADPVAPRRECAERLGAVAVTPEFAEEAVRAIAPDGAAAVIEAAGPRRRRSSRSAWSVPAAPSR
jgi:alcohol dehydrogenase